MTPVEADSGGRLGAKGDTGADVTPTPVGIGRGMLPLGGAGDWTVLATGGIGQPAGGLPELPQ